MSRKLIVSNLGEGARLVTWVSVALVRHTYYSSCYSRLQRTVKLFVLHSMIYSTQSGLWERFTTRRERTTDNLEGHKGEVRTAVRTDSDSESDARVTVSLAVRETTHQTKPAAARIRIIKEKNTRKRDKKKATKHSESGDHHHSVSDDSTTASSSHDGGRRSGRVTVVDRGRVTYTVPGEHSGNSANLKSVATDLPSELRPEWQLLNMGKTTIAKVNPMDIRCTVEEDFESKDWKVWCAEFNIYGESVREAELIMRWGFNRLMELWTGTSLAKSTEATKFLFNKYGVYVAVWVLEKEWSGFGRYMKRCVDAVGVAGKYGSRARWLAIVKAVDGMLELYMQKRRANPVGALTTCTNCKTVINNGAVKDKFNCGGCHKVAYCGRECQKADWKVHKTWCRSLQKENCQRLQEENLQEEPFHMLQAYRFEGDDDGCTGRASRVLPTLWESDSMVMAESDGADGDVEPM